MRAQQRSIPLFKPFMPEGAHAALKPVLESGQLGAGPQVEAFEARLSAWFGTQEAVALSDASAALTLALFLSGVGPGKEVITSPLACSATVSPIANLFSKPVWCDIDPTTGMPDPESVATLINEKTRAILLYHWSGDVADINGMLALAQQHGVKLVEDASEAWGAHWQGHPLGGIADFTVYSFYATKHINTGDGAVLLANEAETARSARHLRRFGINPKAFRLPNGDLNPDFDIPVTGFNFPMNEIAATLGLAQLDFSDTIVARHRANGQFYDNALAGIPGLQLLNRHVDSVSGFWTYSLLAERRADLLRKLHSFGIGAQRLHLRNDRYSCFEGGNSHLPGVRAFDARNLSLPCGWWVGEEEREFIAHCIRAGW